MKDEEKDMWQAIGVDRARCDVWANKDPAGNDGIENISERVKNLAKGLQARSDEVLERPGPLTGNAPWEQRTSWLLKNGMRPGSSDRDHPRVHELFTMLEPVWQQAQRMDGKNKPMNHSYAGRREFDLNVDGFAHYGMLPDFLQDLRNIGLSEEDLQPLYSSAEAFVQAWERCTGA
jgi:hypothetical protein